MDRMGNAKKGDIYLGRGSIEFNSRMKEGGVGAAFGRKVIDCDLYNTFFLHKVFQNC